MNCQSVSVTKGRLLQTNRLRPYNLCYISIQLNCTDGLDWSRENQYILLVKRIAKEEPKAQRERERWVEYRTNRTSLMIIHSFLFPIPLLNRSHLPSTSTSLYKKIREKIVEKSWSCRAIFLLNSGFLLSLVQKFELNDQLGLIVPSTLAILPRNRRIGLASCFILTLVRKQLGYWK